MDETTNNSKTIQLRRNIKMVDCTDQKNTSTSCIKLENVIKCPSKYDIYIQSRIMVMLVIFLVEEVSGCSTNRMTLGGVATSWSMLFLPDGVARSRSVASPSNTILNPTIFVNTYVINI